MSSWWSRCGSLIRFSVGFESADDIEDIRQGSEDRPSADKGKTAARGSEKTFMKKLRGLFQGRVWADGLDETVYPCWSCSE